MSNIAKLLILSALLSGCNCLPHKGNDAPAKAGAQHKENSVSRNVSAHTGHITQDTAAHANAVSEGARVLLNRP